MATISSLGIGSGLDSESIVTKLAALEKAPLQALETKATIQKAQISSFGQIQSQFAALSDAASVLSASSSWGAKVGSSSNATAAAITVTSAAAATSFTLDVDQLARGQSVSSASVASGGLVGAGTMTLRLGTWSGGTTDNSGAISAEAAVAAAQSALTTANGNKVTADATLLTATGDKSVADAAYTLAAADALGPDTDLAAANLNLATKQSAYNLALSDYNSANGILLAKQSAQLSASSNKSNADSALLAAQGAYTLAQSNTVAKLALYGPADVAADTAVYGSINGALAGASALTNYAAGPGVDPLVGTYSQAYSTWANAVAANDRSSPTKQSVEDAALSAVNLALADMQANDTANGTTLVADVGGQLSGFTSPSAASLLKADAATKLSDYNVAEAAEVSALSAVESATDLQSSTASLLGIADAELAAAQLSEASAQGALTTATNNRDAAVLDQGNAALVAAPFDLVLVDKTAAKVAAQSAFNAASSAATLADAAVTTATTNLSNAQSGLTSARPTFTPSGLSSDVAIAVTVTDTVATLATKINAANAGVVATVFNDGSGDRLQLRSSGTGVASGFRIQVADTGDSVNDDNFGLSRFAYDPQASSYGMASSGISATYAQDAKARINGIAVTSSSNTLANNFPGVSITLSATTTTNYNNVGGTESRASVTIGVRDDVTPVVKNVQAFVTAYNALATSLADMTKYDAATKTPSVFQGDAAVLGIQSVMRNMIGSISTGSAYQRLNDIGLERQLNGTLSMNTSKLGVAANNGSELQKFFTQDNKNTQTNGFALKLVAFSKGVLASGGAVSNKAVALQKQLAINATEQTRVNDRAAMVEARLRKQYAALDGRMAGLTALNAYVAQQVTTWNKSTG